MRSSNHRLLTSLIADKTTAPDDAAGTARRFALFDYGFRPFFLFAGCYALAVVPLWLYYYAHADAPFGALPAMYWHAHEMIYGFATAAIAGFLLTAVASWTGTRGFGGPPLIVVATLWLLGRVAMAAAGRAPFWMLAIAELAFLPALALLLTPPLIRSFNRNTPLLAVLGVLWLIDGVFMLALKHGDLSLAARAINVAIDIVLVLVTVIGGRIVPSFTANALRRNGLTPNVVSHTQLEIAVIASTIAIAAVDVFAPTGTLSGALAALAAALHAMRLSGWRSFKTRGESILWVLHVGYAWLPMGLALKACWLLGGVDWAMKWQHALTAGVFATMILAVMTRASLGHTGRPLVVSRFITAAYLLLTLGVALRVFGGALWPQHYVWIVSIAGAAWSLSFLLYVVEYAPILIRPRADGKPG